MSLLRSQDKHPESSTNPAVLDNQFVDPEAFQFWSERKLSGYQETMRDVVVDIKDPTHLTLPERSALLERLRKLNVVVYRCQGRDFTKKDLKVLGLQLGLSRLDRNLCADGESISSVRVAESTAKTRYIPYTNQPLGWHTDGYYNNVDRTIRSFTLHCVHQAHSGGINTFLDPEIVYLLVKHRNAEYAASLTQPNVFSVPANIEDGRELRPLYTGPVFSIDPANGCLHMRYSARSRNISWNSATEIQEAVEYLKTVIEQAVEYAITHKLESGQGVICNNSLHKRTGFVNGSSVDTQRLLYRARYYDRVLGT
ncbi:MAG: TauD/TfdA family dioxygenase [Arenicellales bacterium]|nr:TauD/TfdA family dioxygenase [Arenicellales bacterium]